MCRLILLLGLMTTLSAQANLGETVEQCVARYGRPVHFSEANPQDPFGTLTFAAGAYVLLVFVAENHEVGARVSKTDGSAFSDAERKQIMMSDTAGAGWMPAASEDPVFSKWSRADNAMLTYDSNKHFLIFTSPAMTKVIQDFAARNIPPKSP